MTVADRGELKNPSKYLGNELEYLKRVLEAKSWSATGGSWNQALERKMADDVLAGPGGMRVRRPVGGDSARSVELGERGRDEVLRRMRRPARDRDRLLVR